MKPCEYRYDIGDAGRYGCRCERIHHLTPGIALQTTCEACPFAGRGNNGSRAVVSARAQRPGCRECDKKRQIQFVWPYWAGGAVGDELRWSMRSIATHCIGQPSFMVIGDRPAWYTGPYIPQARVGRHTPNRCFRDMLSKMITLATHPDVQRYFVWMMDDIYALKPFTWRDIDTPRAEPWRGSRGNSWQRIKTNTMRALSQNGLPNHDYATHLCHTVRKTRLAQLVERYDLRTNTMLWEVLYGNSYRTTPISPRPFFARIVSRMSEGDVESKIRHATFVNNNSSAWCDGLRAVLMKRLPNPCNAETGEVGAAAIIPRHKSGRRVRRRPAGVPGAYP